MRKIILPLLLMIFMASCGKSKSEQMLYNYQQKVAKSLNFDINDLSFEIKKIDKVSDITAADSIKYLRHSLSKYWTKNPETSLSDTLSFKYVKSVLNEAIAQNDTLNKMYQEAVLTAIRVDDFPFELESKRKRDKAMNDMLSDKTILFEVESIENYYNRLSVKPDSILSSKYRAIYSQNNPVLGNAKQTFDKVFYTNSAQTEFVKVESTEEE